MQLLEDMTKEELVEYIRKLEKMRAFSYADRMKLAILDESPFTIWASDRDCKITFWDGKCESLYGYTKQEAIGKDYIRLFVSEDEQVAARKDQISIIDHGEVFHNIANDKGQNGNILHLITNCRRIRDPDTGEYWNAEMGIVIDYYEDEKERLNQVIAESRRIKSCITQFIETTNQYKEQFDDRKTSLFSSMRSYERKAIALNKRRQFRERTESVKNRITAIEDALQSKIDEYFEKIKSCGSYDSCESTRQRFLREYANVLYEFEDIVLDVEEISEDFNCGNTIVSSKDALMRDTATRNRVLVDLMHNLLMKAEQEITDYKGLGVSATSQHLRTLVDQRDKIVELKEKIDSIADKVHNEVVSASSDEELIQIRIEMENAFKAVESELNDIKRRIEG